MFWISRQDIEFLHIYLNNSTCSSINFGVVSVSHKNLIIVPFLE